MHIRNDYLYRTHTARSRSVMKQMNFFCQKTSRTGLLIPRAADFSSPASLGRAS